MNIIEETMPLHKNFNRRKFILDLTRVAGITVLLNTPIAGKASGLFALKVENVTVGQIIDLFIEQIPNASFSNTVDTLKSGSREMKVTGILTTMFATVEVIRKAISLGANFIIAHEPTFYNHTDATDWLANDDVYHYKAELLKQHNITVWRNHDYIHSLQPDGVSKGLLKQLDWTSYYKPTAGNVLMIPSTSLGSLIEHLKTKLAISKVRYIGDISQNCQKVLLMPGASGGTKQITLTSKEKPDVLICGELAEWETAEYIRDARAKGDKLSLIVLGHIASEEPGSEFMASWLKEKFPSINTTHIPSNNSLSFL